MTTAISSRRTETGFVLVAVIWVLAALSLIVGFIATQLQDLQLQAFTLESRKLAVLDQLAIEQTFLYLAATRSGSYAGLRTQQFDASQDEGFDPFFRDYFISTGNELMLDGRSYVVRGDHLLSIQDAGSLVSLRSANLERLSRLLDGYGVSIADRDRLIAALSDYTDRDSLPALNGAERHEYERRQILPPTNRFLTNPWQLLNVLGWREILLEVPELIGEVTIYVGDRENYNTMTRKGLETLFGGDGTAVNSVINYRLNNHFSSIAAVHEVTGRLDESDPLMTAFTPSNYFRMLLSNADGSNAHLIGLTLTPDSNLAPWEIDYRFKGSSSEMIYEQRIEMGPLAPPTDLLR